MTINGNNSQASRAITTIVFFISNPERLGEHRPNSCFWTVVDINRSFIRQEFCKHLTARATAHAISQRRSFTCIGAGHGDCDWFQTSGDCCKDGVSFCTNRKPV